MDPMGGLDPFDRGSLPVERVLVADVIVVGTGVAGLTAALAAGGQRIHLLTKAAFSRGGGSSPWAQGGVAAAVGPDDSPALHARDTLAAGDGTSDASAVDILTREGPDAVRRLIELGARFDRDGDGRLALGREAAHGRRRVLHARDATGAEIVRALLAAVAAAPGIRIHEHCFAWDLVTHAGRVVGLLALHDGGEPVLHLAPTVVLATGGCGQLFAQTTNPPEVTGDGIAMAARAGARLADMCMVQFHPTALDVGADPMPLVTEALRGEGAVLIDERGRRFMLEADPAGELAPRDIVARGIHRHQAAGHRVYLDASQALGASFPERFPTVIALCQARGIDPRREPIPVAPAAHYFMGGILVDDRGRSSLPGLWACGETACSGLHGANRLASNSLLEGLVFGRRVAEDLLRELDRNRNGIPTDRSSDGEATRSLASTSKSSLALRFLPDPSPYGLPASQPPADALGQARARLRRLMWEHVSLVRDRSGLQQVLDQLPEIESALSAQTPSRRTGELRNLLTLSRLVTGAALARPESRGGHFRSDFPDRDPSLARRVILDPSPSEIGVAIELEPEGISSRQGISVADRHHPID